MANSGHMHSMAPFGFQMEKPRNDQHERVQYGRFRQRPQPNSCFFSKAKGTPALRRNWKSSWMHFFFSLVLTTLLDCLDFTFEVSVLVAFSLFLTLLSLDVFFPHAFCSTLSTSSEFSWFVSFASCHCCCNIAAADTTDCGCGCLLTDVPPVCISAD